MTAILETGKLVAEKYNKGNVKGKFEMFFINFTNCCIIISEPPGVSCKGPRDPGYILENAIVFIIFYHGSKNQTLNSILDVLLYIYLLSMASSIWTHQQFRHSL